jgi:hypothetical protein
MVTPDNKNKTPHEESRLNRTGEDIDMLREQESSPQSDDSTGSYHYKDDYDGA